jgi:hypothetical protein
LVSSLQLTAIIFGAPADLFVLLVSNHLRR